MAAHHKGFSREEFIRVYKELQSSSAVAKHFGVSMTTVTRRRQALERRGVILPQFDTRPAYIRAEVDNSRAVYKLEIPEGRVLIGSDFHIWSRPWTTMQRAFLRMAGELKPDAVVLNGDVFDGARVSRHPSIGWESKPTVKQELESVGDYLGELLKLCGKAKRVWCAGNHDLRLESRIAAVMPEMEGVKGVHLKDWYPEWEPCWRVDINSDIVVKHRGQGGEHADHNNVVKGGKTVITGHDHRANVTAYRDYRGIRWGVRCGYMGESPLDPQFVHYLEASEAVNWHPAFVVLTFVGGRLLWPELCVKHDDGVVNFRGQLITV